MPAATKAGQRRYQRNWWQRRRQAWIASQGGGCKDCGRTDTLQAHHSDPATKVSHRIWSWADDRRLPELAKCELLCRRCHGIRHRKSNGSPRISPRTLLQAGEPE